MRRGNSPQPRRRSGYIWSLALAAATGFFARVLGVDITWALGWAAVVLIMGAVSTTYLENRAMQTAGGGGFKAAWRRSRFSLESKRRRTHEALSGVDEQLKQMAVAEATRDGFTQYGAAGALFGAAIGSISHARWYVAPPEGSPRTLLFGSSDEVTRVEATSPDEGDALDARRRFESSVTTIRESGLFSKRQALVARLNKLER